MNVLTMPRKTRIVLTDYPYRQDIENRLLLSHLSVFEVDLLCEILHCSLNISIEQLADSLDIELAELLPALDKLAPMKLFKRLHHTLIVDKEMRKYYEIQMEKFDEDFQPDLEFLQGLLNKVPIQVLPLWYAIPRHSDNIFASIIENYFLTPKIFRQYLNELEFDDPLLSNIMDDVYQAPGFKMRAQTLIDKYHLSREAFEEALLMLEYHFVCCLSYSKIGNHWEETVTPFYELHEFMLFEDSNKPQPIHNTSSIIHSCPEEFGFIKEMGAVILACQSKQRYQKEFKPLFLTTQEEYQHLFEKLIQIGYIAEDSSEKFSATEKGLLWIKKTIPEQVNELTFHWLITPSPAVDSPHLWNARNLRLIEKYLKRLKTQEWVYMEDFLKGFIAPLGNREAVMLKNKGKKWKYALPSYQPEELAYVRVVITERLYELGIILTGQHHDKACFCVTAFGHQFIH